MPVSSALRRLLRVRDIEEEQQRLVLESALGDLQILEDARKSAIARERAGRALLSASVSHAEATDRIAALVEVQTASRRAFLLVPRIFAAESIVLGARQRYLEKRLERRQVQTLIEEAEAQHAIEMGRRSQQTLDDAFGARRHHEGRQAGERPVGSRTASASGSGVSDRATTVNHEQGTTKEADFLPRKGTRSKS